MIERVRQLLEAVRRARVEANTTEVTQLKIGEVVLKHVFGDLLNGRAQS